MQWCFNEHNDVPVDIKDFIDNASGGQFNNLTIEEINEFLEGLVKFEYEMSIEEEDYA